MGLPPVTNTNGSGGNVGNGNVLTGPVAVLTDGAISNTGVETTDLPNLYTIGSNAQVTYALGSAPNGYNLSQINIYSEWNDSGRSNITLSDISYSTVASPTVFNAIPNSNVDYGSGASENLASLTAPGGILASGVYAIRFDFGGQQNGWVGYAELEVVGTTTAANILPTTTALTIATGSTFDLGGISQQVASLSDGTPDSGGSILNSSTGIASVLTLSATGGSTTFSGTIQDGAGGLSLVMSGSGTQILAGSNTYSGSTTLGGGTLQLGNRLAVQNSTVDVTPRRCPEFLQGYHHSGPGRSGRFR